MKKSLPFASTLCLLAIQFLANPTASVFAQGTVIFNNRLSGTTHIYAPLGPGDTLAIRGNASNDGPPGSTDYGGRFTIGAFGNGGQYGAGSTFAQLLGAPGSNAPESQLLPAINPPSSFRSGLASGNLVPTAATFNNILPEAPFGSFEMVVWDNILGLYPTWAQASVAWQSGLIAAGVSPEFTLANIGGGSLNTPPVLIPGLVSFNLYFIPEPTTAALAALGAVVSFILRRARWNSCFAWASTHVKLDQNPARISQSRYGSL